MNRVGNLLVDLAACLHAEILRSETPDVCWIGAAPGAAVAQEYSGDCEDTCGMGWVRLTQAYPSDTLGVQNTRPGNCQSGLGMQIEVGMMRCFPLNEDGSPPSDEQMLDGVNLQTEDMLTMMRAIQCCDALASEDYVLGLYQPQGPTGLLVGGFWTLTASLI